MESPAGTSNRGAAWPSVWWLGCGAFLVSGPPLSSLRLTTLQVREIGHSIVPESKPTSLSCNQRLRLRWRHLLSWPVTRTHPKWPPTRAACWRGRGDIVASAPLRLLFLLVLLYLLLANQTPQSGSVHCLDPAALEASPSGGSIFDSLLGIGQTPKTTDSQAAATINATNIGDGSGTSGSSNSLSSSNSNSNQAHHAAQANFNDITHMSYRNGQTSDKVTLPGDILLGGLFPIHMKGTKVECGQINRDRGIQRLEAMLYALDRINADSELLPNIKLGAILLDSCSSSTYALNQSLEFIRASINTVESSAFECKDKSTPRPKYGSKMIAGVIGGSYSEVSLQVANLLRLFRIPQVSYASTGTALSDKTLYDLFARTVPSDMFQARAIADIVNKLNWSYVSLVSSEGLYGDSGSKEFAKQASARRICIATHEKLSPTMGGDAYDSIVASLLKRNATGVVLFTRAEDTRELLLAAKRAQLTRNFAWVAADGWGTHQKLIEGVEEVAWGAITVELQAKAIPGFDQYMKELTPWANGRNPWFSEYWQEWFNCQLEANLLQQQQRLLGNNAANQRRRQAAGSSLWSDPQEPLTGRHAPPPTVDDGDNSVLNDDYDLSASSGGGDAAARARRSPKAAAPTHPSTEQTTTTKTATKCSSQPSTQPPATSEPPVTSNNPVATNVPTTTAAAINVSSANDVQRHRTRRSTVSSFYANLAADWQTQSEAAERVKQFCSPNLRISESNGYRQEQKVQFVVDAVYAMAHALHKAWWHLCDGQPGVVCEALKELNGGEFYTKYLLNVSFKDLAGSEVKFDERGDGLGRYNIYNYRRNKPQDLSSGAQPGDGGSAQNDSLLSELDLPGGGNSQDAAPVEGVSGNEFQQQDKTLATNGGGSGSGQPMVVEHIYTSNVEFEYASVGRWTESEYHLAIDDIQFLQGEHLVPESYCSKPCELGQAKIMRAGDHCCWICKTCQSYEFLPDEFSCQDCGIGRWPVPNKTSCYDLPQKYLRWDSVYSLISLSIACLGIALTLFVSIIFIKYLDTPVVKASGRELSFILLAGIAICHLSSFVLLSKPTIFICGSQRFLVNFGFALMYASLLVKTNRISRIFNCARKSAKRPSFISPKSQMLITGILVAIQIFLTIVWFVFEPPGVRADSPEGKRDEVILKCRAKGKSFIISLVYNMILITTCTVYAVKTRKIPENFNESKFIGFTMYTTIVIWLAFVTMFFGTNNSYEIQINTMCVCISLSAYVTLFCLFSPKISIILLHPDKNVRKLTMNSATYKRAFKPATSFASADGRNNLPPGQAQPDAASGGPMSTTSNVLNLAESQIVRLQESSIASNVVNSNSAGSNCSQKTPTTLSQQLALVGVCANCGAHQLASMPPDVSGGGGPAGPSSLLASATRTKTMVIESGDRYQQQQRWQRSHQNSNLSHSNSHHSQHNQPFQQQQPQQQKLCSAEHLETSRRSQCTAVASSKTASGNPRQSIPNQISKLAGSSAIAANEARLQHHATAAKVLHNRIQASSSVHTQSLASSALVEQHHTPGNQPKRESGSEELVLADVHQHNHNHSHQRHLHNHNQLQQQDQLSAAGQLINSNIGELDSHRRKGVSSSGAKKQLVGSLGRLNELTSVATSSSERQCLNESLSSLANDSFMNNASQQENAGCAEASALGWPLAGDGNGGGGHSNGNGHGIGAAGQCKESDSMLCNQSIQSIDYCSDCCPSLCHCSCPICSSNGGDENSGALCAHTVQTSRANDDLSTEYDAMCILQLVHHEDSLQTGSEQNSTFVATRRKSEDSLAAAATTQTAPKGEMDCGGFGQTIEMRTMAGGADYAPSAKTMRQSGCANNEFEDPERGLARGARKSSRSQKRRQQQQQQLAAAPLAYALQTAASSALGAAGAQIAVAQQQQQQQQQQQHHTAMMMMTSTGKNNNTEQVPSSFSVGQKAAPDSTTASQALATTSSRDKFSENRVGLKDSGGTLASRTVMDATTTNAVQDEMEDEEREHSQRLSTHLAQQAASAQAAASAETARRHHHHHCQQQQQPQQQQSATTETPTGQKQSQPTCSPSSGASGGGAMVVGGTIQASLEMVKSSEARRRSMETSAANRSRRKSGRSSYHDDYEYSYGLVNSNSESERDCYYYDEDDDGHENGEEGEEGSATDACHRGPSSLVAAAAAADIKGSIRASRGARNRSGQAYDYDVDDPDEEAAMAAALAGGREPGEYTDDNDEEDDFEHDGRVTLNRRHTMAQTRQQDSINTKSRRRSASNRNRHSPPLGKKAERQRTKGLDLNENRVNSVALITATLSAGGAIVESGGGGGYSCLPHPLQPTGGGVGDKQHHSSSSCTPINPTSDCGSQQTSALESGGQGGFGSAPQAANGGARPNQTASSWDNFQQTQHHQNQDLRPTARTVATSSSKPSATLSSSTATTTTSTTVATTPATTMTTSSTSGDKKSFSGAL